MRSEIRTHDFSAWTNLEGGKDKVDTGTTSEVNHYLTRVNVTESYRVAAPPGQRKGDFGNSGELFLAVKPVWRNSDCGAFHQRSKRLRLPVRRTNRSAP